MKRWPLIRHLRYYWHRYRARRHALLWWHLGLGGYLVPESELTTLDAIWHGEA